jgi:hypothetical protein
LIFKRQVDCAGTFRKALNRFNHNSTMFGFRRARRFIPCGHFDFSLST